MLECIDAVHLTVEVGCRAAETAPSFVEAMHIWDSTFWAADLMDSDDPAGALRVLLDSCRTLVGVISATLGGSP